MAAIVRQQHTRLIDTLKQALKDLDFISWGFSWLFMFASRIAEPLMTLSVLYIIIEAGVPVVHSDGLHNLSVGIMIASPELMLPGSFVMASQAKAQGNERKAYMLYAMCWIFVFITIITLVSLFIFKLDATWFSVVTCARCAAGVGYSILIRVLTHSNQDEQVSPEQIAEQVRNETREMYEPQLQELRNTLETTRKQNQEITAQMEALKVSQFVSNPEPRIEPRMSTETPPLEYPVVSENRNKLEPTIEPKQAPKVTRKLRAVEPKQETNNERGKAREAALRIIKREPHITPADLSKRAKITPQYAGRLLASSALESRQERVS